MKRLPTALALVSALLPTLHATAQTPLTSSTPVIGFYKQTIQKGNNPLVCGFVAKKEFQGAMVSHTPGTANSVISQASVSWTVGQFQTAANPATESSHYIEILSGVHAGLVLDIVSNTATTLTVEGNTAALPANPVSGLVGNEIYCIRKHATLGQILPGGGGLDISDTVTLYNSDNTSTLVSWSGMGWEDAFSGDDRGDLPIYPGQGFVINHFANSNILLTVGGGEVSYIKTGDTKVPLYTSSNPTKALRNMVGAINPLVADSGATDTTPLGNFGLTTGLLSSDVIQLTPANGPFSASSSYGVEGNSITDNFTGDDVTALPVKNGTSIRIRTAGNRILTIPQSFPTP
jgi:hypothetical protein